MQGQPFNLLIIVMTIDRKEGREEEVVEVIKQASVTGNISHAARCLFRFAAVALVLL